MIASEVLSNLVKETMIRTARMRMSIASTREISKENLSIRWCQLQTALHIRQNDAIWWRDGRRWFITSKGFVIFPYDLQVKKQDQKSLHHPKESEYATGDHLMFVVLVRDRISKEKTEGRAFLVEYLFNRTITSHTQNQ